MPRHGSVSVPLGKASGDAGSGASGSSVSRTSTFANAEAPGWHRVPAGPSCCPFSPFAGGFAGWSLQALNGEAVTPQGDRHKAGSGARGESGGPSPVPHSFSLCQRRSRLSEGCGCCAERGKEPGSPAASALPRQIAVRWVSRESH